MMNVKYYIPIFYILFCLTSAAYSQQPDSQLTVQFHEAGISYKIQDYKKAIELYEGIVKAGWVSGELYYNLGNSYLKNGKLGEAILNYERARRLMPRDSDLISNYHYALSQIKDEGEFGKEPFINRLINRYADFFSFDEITVMVFVSFFLTGIIYFLGLFLKWPTRVYVVSIVLLCLFLSGNGFILAYKIGQQKNLAVVFKKANAKFEPLPDASVHFELTPGWRVKILMQESGWVKVKRLDGKVGWIKQEAVEKI